jgi:hypothetical protein
VSLLVVIDYLSIASYRDRRRGAPARRRACRSAAEQVIEDTLAESPSARFGGSPLCLATIAAGGCAGDLGQPALRRLFLVVRI